MKIGQSMTLLASILVLFGIGTSTLHADQSNKNQEPYVSNLAEHNISEPPKEDETGGGG